MNKDMRYEVLGAQPFTYLTKFVFKNELQSVERRKKMKKNILE